MRSTLLYWQSGATAKRSKGEVKRMRFGTLAIWSKNRVKESQCDTSAIDTKAKLSKATVKHRRFEAQVIWRMGDLNQ